MKLPKGWRKTRISSMPRPYYVNRMKLEGLRCLKRKWYADRVKETFGPFPTARAAFSALGYEVE